MGCKDCTSKRLCKRHRRKIKASSGFIPNPTLPPPYAATELVGVFDEVCGHKSYSFASSNLGNGTTIGAIAGVRHRIIVKNDNGEVRLDAILSVGVTLLNSDVIIGNPSMIVNWDEVGAVVSLNQSLILPGSAGTMEHLVEFNGTWSSNNDTTDILRWRVDFVYNNPVEVEGQADTVWVDDGCTIDFSALNNTDGRAIESVLQNGTTLTSTSGVPTNQTYTSNPITTTTTISIGIGEFAPQMYIESSGADGYLRVEWNDGTSLQVDDIPPNTIRSYVIDENIVIKITASIVNLDTGDLDDDRVSISPPYKFPPRIDEVTLDGIPQNGTPAASIPVENGIDKALEFEVTMGTTDVRLEARFVEVEKLDFDFENALCVDNAANNEDVVTIRDTESQVVATQTTPSRRATYENNGLKMTAKPLSSAVETGYRFQAITGNHESIFMVCEVNQVPPVTTAQYYGRNLDYSTTGITTPQLGVHIFSFYTPYFSSSFGASSNPNDDCFGIYYDARAGNKSIDYPVPSFSMASNLNKKLGLFAKASVSVKLEDGVVSRVYPDPADFAAVVYRIGGTQTSPIIFPNNIQGEGVLYRLTTTGKLTLNEQSVLEVKFKSKYGL